MIQLNLLPEVKLQYIKAKRIERIAVLSAAVIAGASMALFILLFLAVNVWQKQRIESLSASITSQSEEIKSIDQLDRILTVQQQLKSLPALHDKKPAVNSLFRYLSQVTPAEATISNLNIDFEGYKISLSGEANSVETVNQYVDTFKFTDYTTDDGVTKQPAFGNVVLESVGKGQEKVPYTISLNYQAVLFDNTVNTAALIVPKNFVTTRSVLESPRALFETPTEKQPGGGTNEPQPAGGPF